MAEGVETTTSDQIEKEDYDSLWDEQEGEASGTPKAPTGEEAKPPEGEEEEPPEGEAAKPPAGEEAKPPEGEEGKPPEGEEEQPSGEEAKPPEGEEGKPPEEENPQISEEEERLANMSDAEYHEQMVVPNLPLDAEVNLPNGETIKLSQIRDDWPEMAVYTEFVIVDTINNILESAIENGRLAKGSDIAQFLDKQKMEEIQQAVIEKHADATEVMASKEFADWKKAQPPIMHKAMESEAPEDRAYVLDQYKASKAAPVVKKVKAEQEKKKKKVDALHSESLSDGPQGKGKATAPSAGGGGTEEFDELWDEFED